MNKLSLGDRMKQYYEQAYDIELPMRLPVIVRVDGRAFHTFTRGMEKPMDDTFIGNMARVAVYLCDQMQNARIAYIQSDEISVLMTPYIRLDTQAWFGGSLQKTVSLASSLATTMMTLLYNRHVSFDARAFVIPEDEVCNYFLWRQRDAERNSILGYAQSLCSHKQLHGKNKDEMQNMMFAKGLNWNNVATHKKRGYCAFPQTYVDWEIPIFSQDRDYIERNLSRDSN